MLRVFSSSPEALKCLVFEQQQVCVTLISRDPEMKVTNALGWLSTGCSYFDYVNAVPQALCSSCR